MPKKSNDVLAFLESLKAGTICFLGLFALASAKERNWEKREENFPPRFVIDVNDAKKSK